MGIIELKKPPNTACAFCTGHSCTIHDDPDRMPPTCRDFSCGWLGSGLPVKFRPNNLHMMVTGEDANLKAIFVHVDPLYPQTLYVGDGKELMDLILRFGAFPCILVTTGDDYRVVSNDPIAKAVLEKKIAGLETIVLD